MTVDHAISTHKAVHWKQVGLFLVITFGAAWLLDLVLYLTGGMASRLLIILLTTQMTIPAFTAILLGTFFFLESPLYYKTCKSKIRWFTYYFMAQTVAFVLCILVVVISPGSAKAVEALTGLLAVAGLVMVVVVRIAGGKEVFLQAGMGFGTIKCWFVYGGALVMFYLLLFGLNALLVPGAWGDPAVMFPNESQAGWPPALLWGIASMNAILIGPFTGLVVTFGEEYGWRGYLQGELEKLGRIQGVGLLGIIWGLWHAPVIVMGYNYPGEPFWGVVMMTLFCIFMSYVLAYSMYKSGGLWTVVYLHALNNGAASLLLGIAFVTTSSLFSFSLSLYALLPMGLVVLGILSDKVWRKQPSRA